MAVIAVFGGTFNPFHIGHYQMLKHLCELTFLDRVFVMPDKIPPHKVCDFLASDKDRIEMCRIVCEDFPKAELCLAEFDREGKSYTYDTVKYLKQKYPNDRYYFAIGGDMLATLDKWYNWQSLIKEVSFIAFRREGVCDFDRHIKRFIDLGADIVPINSEITEISSTDLRASVTKQFFPPMVYQYILDKGIYNGSN